MPTVDELIQELKRLKAEKQRQAPDPWFAHPKENKNQEFDRERLFQLGGPEPIIRKIRGSR